MRILVTGGAGFLGSHLSERLVADGHRVTILDDFNDFYDPRIKEENLRPLGKAVRIVRGDIRSGADVTRAFSQAHPEVVVHLAARAGIRPSLAEPLLYYETNVLGTLRLLAEARKTGLARFVFASSSSVYGADTRLPFREDDSAERAVSPYGATKRSAEHHVRVHHERFALNAVCLRLFTVYGPRQRPDMAIHKFALLLERGEPVPIHGDGSTSKEYIYVSDVVDGVVAAIERPIAFATVNLGGGRQVPLQELAERLAGALGKPLRIRHLPLQPGDVMVSRADPAKARAVLGFAPRVDFDAGLSAFVAWFRRRRPGASE